MGNDNEAKLDEATATPEFTLKPQTQTDTVTVTDLTLETAGFVVVREVVGGRAGQIVEISQYLPAGEYTDVRVDLGETFSVGGLDISGEFPAEVDLVAVVYEDDGSQTFNPQADAPAYASGQVRARLVSSGELAGKQVADPGQPATSTEVADETVTYTDDGFSPQEITVSPGDTVVFVNKSSRPMWVASSQHPTHEVLPTFDQFDTVGFNGRYRYTFQRPGEWRYHDHVNAARQGTVVVE